MGTTDPELMRRFKHWLVDLSLEQQADLLREYQRWSSVQNQITDSMVNRVKRYGWNKPVEEGFGKQLLHWQVDLQFDNPHAAEAVEAIIHECADMVEKNTKSLNSLMNRMGWCDGIEPLMGYMQGRYRG